MGWCAACHRADGWRHLLGAIRHPPFALGGAGSAIGWVCVRIALDQLLFVLGSSVHSEARYCSAHWSVFGERALGCLRRSCWRRLLRWVGASYGSYVPLSRSFRFFCFGLCLRFSRSGSLALETMAGAVSDCDRSPSVCWSADCISQPRRDRFSDNFSLSSCSEDQWSSAKFRMAASAGPAGIPIRGDEGDVSMDA